MQRQDSRIWVTDKSWNVEAIEMVIRVPRSQLNVILALSGIDSVFVDRFRSPDDGPDDHTPVWADRTAFDQGPIVLHAKEKGYP